jgi:hypothetical protein
MKIIISETQNKFLFESRKEKLKKFLKDKFNIDFTDKIEMITSMYDVPSDFNVIESSFVRKYLNFWGPMYYFSLDGTKFLYQDRGSYEWFMDENGFELKDDEIIKLLDIDKMGLRFNDILKLYFEENN